MTPSAKEWLDTFLKDLQNSRSNQVTAGAIKTHALDTSGMSGPDFSGDQGAFSKILDFIERPLYALGGAATSIVDDVRAGSDPNFKDTYNDNPLDAFWKGLSGQEHDTLGTAVHHALPKNATSQVMAGILGFGADVIGDPLNLTPLAGVKVAKAIKGATKLGKQEALLGGVKDLVGNEKVTEQAAKAIKTAHEQRLTREANAESGPFGPNVAPTGMFKTQPLPDNFFDGLIAPRNPIDITTAPGVEGLNLPRTPVDIPTPELIVKTQAQTTKPVESLVRDRAVGGAPIDLARESGNDIVRTTKKVMHIGEEGVQQLEPRVAYPAFVDAIDKRFTGTNTFVQAAGKDSAQHFISPTDIYRILGETVTSHSVLGVVRTVTPTALFRGVGKALDLTSGVTPVAEKVFKDTVRAEMEKAMFTRPNARIAHNIRPLLQGDVVEYSPSGKMLSLISGDQAKAITKLRPGQTRVTKNRTMETVQQGVDNIVNELWLRRNNLLEASNKATDLHGNVTELAARSIADNVMDDVQRVADLSQPAGSTAQTIRALNDIHKSASTIKDEMLSTVVNRKVAERISQVTNAEDFATAREIRANLFDVQRGDLAAVRTRRAHEAKNTHIPEADKLMLETEPALLEEPYGLEVEYLLNKKYGPISSILHTSAHSNSDLGKLWKARRAAYYSLAAKYNNGMAKAMSSFSDEVQLAAYQSYRLGILPTNPEVMDAYNAIGPYVDQIFGKAGGLEGSTFLRQGYDFDNINKAMEEVGVKFKMEDVDSWKDYEPKNLQDFLRRMNAAALNMHLRSSVADHFTASFGSSSGGFKAGTTFKKLPKISNEIDTNIWKHLDKTKYYPQEAIDQLIQVERLLKQSNSFKGDKGGLARFINGVVDPFLLIWKPGMTIARPGHGVRNGVSDYLLNTAAGVHSPRHYIAAMRILKSGKSLNPEVEKNFIHYMETKPRATLDGNYTITLRGGQAKAYSDSEMYKMAFQDGILPSFVQQEDILVDITKSATGLTKVGDRILSTKYMQAMGNFNEMESHYFRLAQYHKLMTDTKFTRQYKTLHDARQAAAAEVRKFHPDTSGLTPAEMKYMRRLIPYYSWTRQILPVIAETLLIRPANLTVVNKGFFNAGMSLGNEPDSLANPFPDDLLAPDYIRDMMGYVGGPMAFNLGSPVESAADLFNGNVSRNFAGMLNPMIKAPVELYNREDIQTGSFLTDLGEYIDRQVPFVNQASSISGISASGTLADWLTGNGFIDQQRAVQRGEKNMLFNRSILNFITGMGLQPVATPTGQAFAAKDLGRSGS